MKLDINISPCPNDTFMFDAIANGRIDTGGTGFRFGFRDIEQLNMALLEHGARAPHISKCSYSIVPRIKDTYVVLDSGSALGRGNGPLLVCRNGVDLEDPGLKIAVPGIHTTANRLMDIFYPWLTGKTPVLFSDIAEAVHCGRFDAGVLIHEGRFTYREKGLKLVCDLGLLWEEKTGAPLPLGAIVARRSLGANAIREVERLIGESIRYAFENPLASRGYVKSHAREMDDQVIDSHIGLFVNDFSLSLGNRGRVAAEEFTGLPAAEIFNCTQ